MRRWIQREPSTAGTDVQAEIRGGGEDWITQDWYAQADTLRFQQVKGVLRLNILHGPKK